jgi:hypothetical protein
VYIIVVKDLSKSPYDNTVERKICHGIDEHDRVLSELLSTYKDNEDMRIMGSGHTVYKDESKAKYPVWRIL